tara:strand:- start:665 stop:1513 length:849 start_codon:yes stop_codon:yes gene_type:complete
MPNVYLQKDLGMIGDLLHSYRKELKQEFLNSTKEFLSEDYFTQSIHEQKEKMKYMKHISNKKVDYSRSPNENYYGYIKKILNQIKTNKWWDRTDYNDHMFEIGAWKQLPIMYNKTWVARGNVDRKVKIEDITFGTTGAYENCKQNYPKTTELITKIRTHYGTDSVNKATFSLLTADSRIPVHTGIENKKSEYVRCHVPVIVPKHTRKELFLEVGGDRVYWSETWGFDNQTYHTATNKTPYHRLIFLIDISRKALSLPVKTKVTLPFMKRLGKIILRKGVDLN